MMEVEVIPIATAGKTEVVQFQRLPVSEGRK